MLFASVVEVIKVSCISLHKPLEAVVRKQWKLILCPGESVTVISVTVSRLFLFRELNFGTYLIGLWMLRGLWAKIYQGYFWLALFFFTSKFFNPRIKQIHRSE